MAAGMASDQPSSMASMELTWNDYIHRTAAGEQQALARLYDDTSRLIYSIAMRILGNPADAEEVTMDVYSQVWKSAKEYNRDRGTPLGWLTMIARSRALDRVRRRSSRRDREAPIEAAGQPISDTDPPEEAVVLAEQRRRVQAALAELSADQRLAIELSFFEGYTHSELAEKLGQPLGTVKTRIRLGMLRLRELLLPGGGKS
jgi:RNA polymerase sigma-70 factor (ECF subfamily)